MSGQKGARWSAALPPPARPVTPRAVAERLRVARVTLRVHGTRMSSPCQRRRQQHHRALDDAVWRKKPEVVRLALTHTVFYSSAFPSASLRFLVTAFCCVRPQRGVLKVLHTGAYVRSGTSVFLFFPFEFSWVCESNHIESHL